MEDRDDDLARIAREMDEVSEQTRRQMQRHTATVRAADRERGRVVARESRALREAIARDADAADAWLDEWRRTSRHAELRRLHGLRRAGAPLPLPMFRTDSWPSAFEPQPRRRKEPRTGSGYDIDIGARISFTRRVWTRGFGGQREKLLVVGALAELTRPDVATRIASPEHRLELLGIGLRLIAIIVEGRLEDILLDALRAELETRREELARLS